MGERDAGCDAGGDAEGDATELGAVEGVDMGGELGLLEPLDDGETPETGPCAPLGGRPATTATRTTSPATDASPPTTAAAPRAQNADRGFAERLPSD